MNRHEHAKMVGTAAVDTVIGLLIEAGYTVEHHDILREPQWTINNKLGIEIRSALWTKHAHSKGRYQFSTRQKADVYILACMTHAPRFFVIPGHIVEPYANVAIWSEFPSKYAGRWAEYLDAWHIIDEELEQCQE